MKALALLLLALSACAVEVSETAGAPTENPCNREPGDDAAGCACALECPEVNGLTRICDARACSYRDDTTCNGCMQGDACVTGTTSDACGLAGLACVQCAEGFYCDGDHRCAPNGR